MAALSEKEIISNTDGAGLCRYLDWDSNFFGFRIARVEKERISPEEILEILSWCRHNEIDCLYYLANSSDAESIRLVEDYRFNLVDVRVTLDRKIYRELKEVNLGPRFNIRLAHLDDLPALRRISGTNIQDTRFYYDPHFPHHLCVALYETWIEVSFNGFADKILVAEIDKKLVGFITCKLEGTLQGKLGLVGVDYDWHRRGIGVALVNSVLNWFTNRQIEHVSVVTQGRNIPAQRLYQRCGFMICSTQLWYHRWFNVNE